MKNHEHLDMEVSMNGGTTIAGSFIMENPINVDDLGYANLSQF